MTPEQISDELMYRNYWWNRRKMLTINPAVMGRVYGQEMAERMEARYQRELESGTLPTGDTLHIRLSDGQ